MKILSANCSSKTYLKVPRQQEEKPLKPAPTSWFIAPFLWLEWACAWIAYGINNLALFRVLEFVGKAIVVAGVVIWICTVSRRDQANIWVAWSAVNSKGGGRRDALEYLYKNKVDLLGLYGEGGFFKDIDLHGADLQSASLSSANLQGANLQNANLQWAHLDGADLKGANLDGSNLSGARLNSADLTGARLNGANAYRAFLIRAVLLTATLHRTNLGGTQLNGANLHRADLDAAQLNGANLYRADLSNANLSNANLLGTNLSNANLTYADFRNANLTGTNLIGADLSGVSDLAQSQVDSSLGDKYTRLPPGIAMPKAWLPR